MRRLFTVAFALLFALGCRDTDTGVQFVGVSQPSDDCEFDTSSTLLAGLWDVNGPAAAYTMGPILGSLLVSRSLDTQSEANTVTINEFEVELLTLSADGELEPLPTGNDPNPYKVATSLVLPVSEGDDATLGVAIATVVPSSYTNYVVNAGQTQLYINLQASGSTAGGLSIKTVDFPWVVSLCAGCLGVDCTAEDADTSATEGCLPGQDGTGYCVTPL